jgi:hypothetical protein
METLVLKFPLHTFHGHLSLLHGVSQYSSVISDHKGRYGLDHLHSHQSTNRFQFRILCPVSDWDLVWLSVILLVMREDGCTFQTSSQTSSNPASIIHCRCKCAMFKRLPNFKLARSTSRIHSAHQGARLMLSSSLLIQHS